MSKLDPSSVYFVESSDDQTVLLALYAQVTDRGVEWFDTVRDRGFKVEGVAADGDATVVKTKNATYRFRPLTLELYRQKVRDRVDGRPDFEDTEELRAFYLQLPG